MRQSVSKKLTKKRIKDTVLLEIAWEVMNQVGGIYTVIRSKAPTVSEKWGNNYCLIGPYDHKQVIAEFDPIQDQDDSFAKAVKQLREMGLVVHYGYWLVTGKPRAVLFDLNSCRHELGNIKYYLWENHGISTDIDEPLLNDVLIFGEMIRIFITELSKHESREVIAHFHEWMAGSAIPGLRKEKVNVKTVFTTHATLLGRYLAMNDPMFYDHLIFHDWQREAKHFNIEAQVNIERAAAHGSHVFTTVSEVTAEECKYLIGREPDFILPNGINKERFEALHEFQNLHQKYKKEIHEFTIGHFFQSYTFDLDKTIYFFTSGRYEYRNKGYDLTLEALARLNHRLKQENSDMTIVMFFVTKRPFHSINPEALQSRAVMAELRHTVDAIKKQIGDALFFEAASTTDYKLPRLDNYIDDYWKLRYRRTIQSWKSDKLPSVVTHNLVDDNQDEVLNFLRGANLLNHKDDRVKIVYHPDFINYTNPLFGMDYGQFVRGCHMGIFPSYYEPWGYTPLECIASGVPTITSDLAGFGDFVKQHISEKNHSGTYIVNRKGKSFDDSANQLYMQMYRFLQLSRRERINHRNRVEASSVQFDWKYLIKYYENAYLNAMSVN